MTKRPAQRHAAPPLDLLSVALLTTALAWWGVSFSHLAGAWGLDTLRHAPTWLGIGSIIAILAVLAPAVANAVQGLAARLGHALAAPGLLPIGVLVVIVAAALLALRDPLHFVGDSGLRLAAITVRGETSSVFPQAAILDRAVNLQLARALRDSFPISDTDALQLVGALVGGLWAGAAVLFLRAIGLHGAPLGAATAVVLASGVTLHFAGYDKFGPLTLGLTLTAAGAARALQGARPWLLAVGVAIALLSHRSGLVILPAVLVVVAELFRRGGGPRRDALLAGAVIAASASLSVPAALTSLRTIDRARHLSTWAASQLMDALQLLWFLCPLWMATLLAASLLSRRPAGREEPRWPAATRLAIALGLLAPLALLVGIRGSQGAARDWDMHVPAAAVGVLATAAVLGLCWQRTGPGDRTPSRSLSLALVLACTTGITLWSLHTDESRQLARIADQLAARSAWKPEAWARAQDFLGIHALRSGRPDAAIAHWERAIEGAPNPRYFYQIALANMRLGRLDAAREGFTRTQQRDQATADAWVGRAMVASGADSMSAALAYVDSALARQPRKWDALELRRKLLQLQPQ